MLANSTDVFILVTVGVTEKMKKILIAEDNEMNRELIETILSHHEFETVTASNGDEAIKVAASALPDLILMDIQMPKIDGFSALAKIRESEGLALIPVVAITGNVMPYDIEKIETSGFNGIIHKPFKIDELLEVVNSFLEHT